MGQQRTLRNSRAQGQHLRHYPNPRSPGSQRESATITQDITSPPLLGQLRSPRPRKGLSHPAGHTANRRHGAELSPCLSFPHSLCRSGKALLTYPQLNHFTARPSPATATCLSALHYPQPSCPSPLLRNIASWEDPISSDPMCFAPVMCSANICRALCWRGGGE